MTTMPFPRWSVLNAVKQEETFVLVSHIGARDFVKRSGSKSHFHVSDCVTVCVERAL